MRKLKKDKDIRYTIFGISKTLTEEGVELSDDQKRMIRRYVVSLYNEAEDNTLLYLSRGLKELIKD